MSIEVWLPVPGFEGQYEVSDRGSVARLPCRSARGRSLRGMFLKPTSDRHGYSVVNLRRRGKSTQRKVHQLVLEAFVAPRPPGESTRHLDGNPRNNHVDNLAWGTHTENMHDKARHGTENVGSRNGQSKLTEADIPEIDQLRNAGLLHREIAARFGVSAEAIGLVLRRDRWAHIPKQ